MATPERYLPGQVARLSIAVADADKAAQDPGALRLMVKPPTGATTIYTYGIDAIVERTAVGAYRADVPLTAVGIWRYRGEGDAPFAGATEGFVVVSASNMA